jgi:hypothetical protein
MKTWTNSFKLFAVQINQFTVINEYAKNIQINFIISGIICELKYNFIYQRHK